MTDEALRTRLAAYYENEVLPQSVVVQLRSRSQSERQSQRWWAQRRTQRWAVAAAALLIATAVLWIGTDLFGAESGRAEQAREIAANHIKAKPVEIEASNYTQLAAAMSLRLGFTPATPERLGAMAVQGARFCSVGERPAALITLIDSAGARATLYQWIPAQPLPSYEFADKIACGGVDVTLWQDGDLAMALAHDNRRDR